jgi:hypothetical protein
VSTFVLFCKSYSTDLKRLVRLAQSIQSFNQENIPFHVSVPQTELALFEEHLHGLNVLLHSDEDILCASKFDAARVQRMPGAISQQVVKSSFWQLGHADMYLCLDSDAFFLRPFCRSDFVHPTDTPYTVLDEAHDLLDDAHQHGKARVVEAFFREARQFQTLFERDGRAYSFGPFPLVWHRAVWESLNMNYLAPRGMSIVDAIEQAPIESRWYGEALLKYQAIALLPCQALFKVYHYGWQMDRDKRIGHDLQQLSRVYSGAIFQSAWERHLDWPNESGSIFSRLGRRLRRRLGRI